MPSPEGLQSSRKFAFQPRSYGYTNSSERFLKFACIYLFTYVHFNTGTIAEDEFQMTNEQQSNCDEHSKCQGDAEAHEQQQ
ncbi:hypothetical protein T12_15428 [Trichinella patagoniensis]|uniref:Uncharacterized protein n=1 Tax=Trichinella patagoniensis TaxID=990121 RepID=A0A0V0ZNU5_9BILA|nr:hypothetical protein T12_15428 [Trichinella patagoniensis]